MRWYIARKRSYTPRSLSTFYGDYRAGLYFRNGPHHGAYVRIGSRLVKIPHWVMPVFAPFNKYTTTMKGINFMKGVMSDE